MGLFEGIAKAAGPALEEGISKAWHALRTPALPEAIARGTAEHPTVLENAVKIGVPTAERAKSVPFAGPEDMRASVRATAPTRVKTIPEHIQDGKTVVGSFFQAHPNLGTDVKKILNESGWRGGAAKDRADQVLKEVWRKVNLVYDHAISADNMAQGLRDGLSHVDGKPLEHWMTTTDQLEQAIGNDESIKAVQHNYRQMLEGLFTDQVNLGWIQPDRKLGDYTPIRKLFAAAEGLANQGGEDFRLRLQNSQFRRTNMQQGGRETNLLLLMHDILSEHMKKVVDHETFNKLMDDPTLNFTDKFENGDVLPKGLISYNPGAGQMGYKIKSPDDSVIDAFGRAMTPITGYSKLVTPGSYIMPETLGNAFRYYNGTKATHPIENAAQRIGRGMARWLTVYNTANTFLNIQSDLLLACLGLPGEKAHPIGILKAYPRAFKKAMQMSFDAKPSSIKMRGEDYDLRKLVGEHGIAESTFFHQVQNQRVSDELARLIPPEDLNKPFILFDALHRFRQGAELAPRIAAGVEAFERTGNISEFGRLGRESTLTYGPNGPQASKVAWIRAASPFIQYVGLSSGRVAELLKAPGSRVRTISTIMALPYATYKWNTHNDEFKQVEESLGDNSRDMMHIILADPDDPSKVWKAPNGKPRVISARFSVSEDVMKQMGLGNMAERLSRVSEGRDKKEDILPEIGQRAVSNLVNTATVIPGMISDAADLTTAHGRKITGMDKVMKYMPITRPLIIGGKAAYDNGPKEGLLRAAEEFTGMKEMDTARKRDVPLDVDLIQAKENFKQAKKAHRNAIINYGADSIEAKDARKELDAMADELKRIAPVLKEEHAVFRANRETGGS